MQEVTEWVLHPLPRESDHAECGEVYISAGLITPSAEEFISSTPNIGAKKLKSHLRGTGDRRRKSQNGFYTRSSPIMPSAEEFASSTPNIGAKNRNCIDIKFFIKNRIEIESSRKNHNRHITIKLFRSYLGC